uniref:Thiamin biosynthesis protein S n=1 Tax=Caloglossa monosticha TaxID=76906 RepID=A0A1Z1M5C7_9FLOR|nr:thiamin biosynthesis protein S [Caloglossa monosticha]ARW61132.1 thiamin biosynthesis protein S [Caloglossa monosticha]
MEDYITVYINGEPFNCESDMSLKSLLLYLEFNLKATIVEYNSKIVELSQYSNIFLHTNDSIEIITIVGGG